MKLLATGDWHGKIIEIKEKQDLIIYIGDFCDFSKIRRMVFELKKKGQKERYQENFMKKL